MLIYSALPISAQWSDKNKGDAFIDYIDIYQQYISGIKGSECGMTPSCSNYAIRAFRTYNPIIAFSMTTDRLVRCGHDHDYYNLDIKNKLYKAIDDVIDSNNQITIRHKRFAYVDTSHIESLKFIRYLMNKGFYNQALLKIQEHIYYNKTLDASIKREIYTNYIRCLSVLDKLEEAIFEYEVNFPQTVKEDPLILLEIAICHIQLKNFVKSHQILIDADKNSSDTIFHSRINMIKAKVFSQEYKWEEARKSFMCIPTESLYKQQAEQNIKVLESAQKIRYKKQTVAGILGVIPGCGYLYAGHKQTALSAFLINTVFGFATYNSIKNKNYGVAALTGTLSLAFYVGNIQGSIKSAKRYNEHKKQDLNNRINVNFNF